MDKSIQLEYTLTVFKQSKEVLEMHKTALWKIKDFRKQLQYFNQNISSLAIHSSAGEIVLKDIVFAENDDIIYLGPYIKPGYRTKKEFNSKHELIFLEERQKEIDRLKAGLEKQNDYAGKLNFFFLEKAGPIHLSNTKVNGNLHSKSIKIEWREAYATVDCVIDLYPKDRNEIEIYNNTIKDHLIKTINNPTLDKVNKEQLTKPTLSQILIKDSTIEMVVKILSQNKLGCCLFVDELSGFFKRMNQYKNDGDEVQKWLELWSGNSILLQRITREHNKVTDSNCSLIGGIQTGLLNILSKGDNEHNGLIHRFLYVYPEPQNKADWNPANLPDKIKADFFDLSTLLLSLRDSDRKIYKLSPDANSLYKEWFDSKNRNYNKSNNEHVKGIIAKYQDYCLRFALLLQVIHDGIQRTGIISMRCMEYSIRLTEYFFANMNKSLKILVPDSPIDNLSKNWKQFYTNLPPEFSIATAIIIGKGLGIKKDTIKTFIYRDAKKAKELFESGKERGQYIKVY